MKRLPDLLAAWSVALWVGGLWAVGYLAAPVLFYNLEDRPVRALWKQPLAGGSPVQVTHFEEPLHYFDWPFDGKALAVSRSSTLSDVVMITNFR